jgi:phosphate transport system substrate-binding protein
MSVTARTTALTGLAPYRPVARATGTIVTWGDPAFGKMMEGWVDGFRTFQPGVRFETFLRGTSTAVGALYTGIAQLGLFGREVRRLERTSWKRMFPYQPSEFTVATGSYNEFAKTVAVAVLVNADNPLTGITLQQLDAIYSRDRKRGAPAPIRRWGQLGLSGEWEGKPVTIFGLDEDTGTANHLQSRLLLDGRWAADVELPPGAPTEMYAGSGGHAADALAQALLADRYAIGFGGFRNLAPGLKALAVADDGGRYVEGTRETVASREYPLSRSVYAVVDKAPDAVWDPKIREFMSFVLSREGQQAVAAEGGYLPLVARIVQAERAKLG